jgi:hypothetical protein
MSKVRIQQKAPPLARGEEENGKKKLFKFSQVSFSQLTFGFLMFGPMSSVGAILSKTLS